jgi:hypothetical protein
MLSCKHANACPAQPRLATFEYIAFSRCARAPICVLLTLDILAREVARHYARLPRPYSHSIVPGGFDVMS